MHIKMLPQLSLLHNCVIILQIANFKCSDLSRINKCFSEFPSNAKFNLKKFNILAYIDFCDYYSKC